MKDYQRAKVYNWEAANIWPGMPVRFDNIQTYINNIWEKMGLKYPPMVKPLPPQVRVISADATRTVVRFPETGTTEKTILHELAHSMTATASGASHQHNEYFVGMAMVLYEKFLGVDLFFMWYSATEAKVKFEKFMTPRLDKFYSVK
jgi:hypothetical protein